MTRPDLDTQAQSLIYATVHGDAAAGPAAVPCARFGLTDRSLRRYRERAQLAVIVTRLGRAALALMILVAIAGLVAGCDWAGIGPTATPRDRCPAPWETDACPDSSRVPYRLARP